MRSNLMRYQAFAFSRKIKKTVKLVDTKEEVMEFLDSQKIYMPQLKQKIEEQNEIEAIQAGEELPKKQKVDLAYL